MSEFVAGSTVHDRYLLQARLVDQSHAGRTVWSGKDTLLDRPVHIYVIETDVEQHLDRARAASQFAVAHVAKIYAIELVDEVGVIVAEAPDGISVQALHSGTPAEIGQARAIIGTAAEALAEAAKHGIYHEELNAESIVLTRRGISVTGLGIASGDLPPEQRTDSARSHEDAVGLLRVFYLLATGVEATDHAPDLPADAGLDPTITAAVHSALRDPESAPPSSQLVAQLMMPWGEVEPLAQSLADANKPVVEAVEEPLEGTPTDIARKSILKKVPTRPSVRRTSVKGAAGVAGAAGAASATGNALTGGAAIFPSTFGSRPVPPSAAPVRTSIHSPKDPAAAAPVAPALPVNPQAPVAANTAWTPGTTAGGTTVPPSAGFAPSVTGEDNSDLANYRLPPVTAYGPAPAPTGPAAIRDPFNLTPWILIGFLVALFLFGKWAIDTALTPQHHGAPIPSQPTTAPPPIATTPIDTGETDNGEGNEETTEPESNLQLPVIQAGTQLDPYGDNNEHPEAVDRAWDGNNQSYWFTRTYNDAVDMAGKPGVGYHISFTDTAYFNAITLNTKSEGGVLEIRATTKDDPEGGQLLASGPLNGVTTFSLSSPVETKEIVLWWTELPQTSGANRVELYEIGFS